MTTKYQPRSKTPIALLFLAGLGQTFAAQPLPETANSDATDIYDQVLAEIPYDRAAIASVALAELNIALRNAKKRAGQTLCHGLLTPSGEALQAVGPLVVEQGANQKIWFYQSLRRAQPLACDRVSRVQFFLEMSRHLPAWVSIRPAGQTTAFSQGVAQPVPSSHLAAR